MRRFNIVHGDTTTAGGTVLALQTHSMNMGRSLAMIGDDVICPKCKTTGRIGPNGPRLQERFMGREAALNRDFCLCACEPKPELINSLDCLSQTMTVEEVIAQGFGAWVGYKDNVNAATNDKLFDDKFVLRDVAGRPVPNAAYVVERATGVFEYGETNQSGHTFLLAATITAENINFYLAG